MRGIEAVDNLKRIFLQDPNFNQDKFFEDARVRAGLLAEDDPELPASAIEADAPEEPLDGLGFNAPSPSDTDTIKEIEMPEDEQTVFAGLIREIEALLTNKEWKNSHDSDDTKRVVDSLRDIAKDSGDDYSQAIDRLQSLKESMLETREEETVATSQNDPAEPAIIDIETENIDERIVALQSSIEAALKSDAAKAKYDTSDKLIPIVEKIRAIGQDKQGDKNEVAQKLEALLDEIKAPVEEPAVDIEGEERFEAAPIFTNEKFTEDQIEQLQDKILFLRMAIPNWQVAQAKGLDSATVKSKIDALKSIIADADQGKASFEDTISALDSLTDTLMPTDEETPVGNEVEIKDLTEKEAGMIHEMIAKIQEAMNDHKALIEKGLASEDISEILKELREISNDVKSGKADYKEIMDRCEGLIHRLDKPTPAIETPIAPIENKKFRDEQRVRSPRTSFEDHSRQIIQELEQAEAEILEEIDREINEARKRLQELENRRAMTAESHGTKKNKVRDSIEKAQKAMADLEAALNE